MNCTPRHFQLVVVLLAVGEPGCSSTDEEPVPVHACDDASAFALVGPPSVRKYCADTTICGNNTVPSFGCNSDSCDPCPAAPANMWSVCGDDGSCAFACPLSTLDCDQDPSNGCEADRATIENCGACGVSCPLPDNATPRCGIVDGLQACVVGECTEGFYDLDNDVSNGCEADETEYRLWLCENINLTANPCPLAWATCLVEGECRVCARQQDSSFTTPLIWRIDDTGDYCQ